MGPTLRKHREGWGTHHKKSVNITSVKEAVRESLAGLGLGS